MICMVLCIQAKRAVEDALKAKSQAQTDRKLQAAEIKARELQLSERISALFSQESKAKVLSSPCVVCVVDCHAQMHQLSQTRVLERSAW